MSESYELPATLYDSTLVNWLKKVYKSFIACHDVNVVRNIKNEEPNDWFTVFNDCNPNHWNEYEYSYDCNMSDFYVTVRPFYLDEKNEKHYAINDNPSIISHSTFMYYVVEDDEADEDGVYGYEYASILTNIQVSAPYTKDNDCHIGYNNYGIAKWLCGQFASVEDKEYAMAHIDEFRAFITIMALKDENHEVSYVKYPDFCIRVNITDRTNLSIFHAAEYFDLMKMMDYEEYDERICEFYVPSSYKFTPPADLDMTNITVAKLPIDDERQFRFNSRIVRRYDITTQFVRATVRVLRSNTKMVEVTLLARINSDDPQCKHRGILSLEKQFSAHAEAIRRWIVDNIGAEYEIWWHIDNNSYLNVSYGWDGKIKGTQTELTLEDLGFTNNIILLYPAYF